MSTATRTVELTRQFEAVNAEIIATVTECSDQQWQQPSANDGRAVGVVAHHVGDVNGAFARIIEKLAAGETFTPTVSMEEVHDNNARHAHDYATVGKTETLEVLQTHGDAILHALRGIDDGTLDRTAGVFGGHEMTVAQVMEWVVIGHTADHLASIRAIVHPAASE